tara:strand:+ start:5938 stop:6294 length:357 start_codon:yes stop_codon:yes gene_type:complete
MAYLKKDDIVFIQERDSSPIQARVIDVRFRRFRKSWKDKKTGDTKSRWKAVPYAVCEVFSGMPAGTEFLIPGYKLRNIEKAGEKLLVLRDQYVTEFTGPWVRTVLEESRQKRAAGGDQ